jgi:hypothetical protein
MTLQIISKAQLSYTYQIITKANSNVSNNFHKKVMTLTELKTEGVAQ